MAEAALELREGRWAPAVAAQRRLRIGRVLLYAVLTLFALYYLAPLYVMIATSLKSAEELREASIFALPHAAQLECGLSHGRSWPGAARSTGRAR